MSDQIPCPTCQAMLRIPAKAGMIRCPKCKTVLAVEPEEPPPPAKPSAPPLPFGRPPGKPSAAAPPPPPPKASQKSTGAAPIRARIAPVSVDELSAGPKPGETSAEVNRREEMRRALDKLDEDERREKARYAVVAEECKWGRFGTRLLAAGAMANVVAGGLFCAYMVSLVTVDGFSPILWLAAAALAFHFLLLVGGFGACVRGPKGVSGAAIAGGVCAVIQFVLSAVAAFTLLQAANLEALNKRASDPEQFLISGMYTGSVFNNLLSVAQLPLFIVAAMSLGASVALNSLVLPVLAGMFEFAKLSLVGIVGNRYAAEARDENLSYYAMRFVHRIFIAVLLGALLFPLSVPIAQMLMNSVSFGKAAGGVIPVLILPVGAIQNAFCLWWVYAWFAQYHTLNEVAEVLVPARVAYKGERLDSY